MIKKLPIQFNDIAIGIIWLFHLCGILGILYGDSQWFVGATPINLLLSFLLLMITSRRSTKVFIIAIIAFIARPLMRLLGKIKIKEYRLPDWLRASIVLLVFMGIVIGIFSYIIPTVLHQANIIGIAKTQITFT
mgnify:CR=1 FL=1